MSLSSSSKVFSPLKRRSGTMIMISPSPMHRILMVTTVVHVSCFGSLLPLDPVEHDPANGVTAVPLTKLVACVVIPVAAVGLIGSLLFLKTGLLNTTFLFCPSAFAGMILLP